MNIKYKNSRNEIRNLPMDENEFLKKEIISYADISFQNTSPYYLKINKHLIREYTRDSFIKTVEYFKIQDIYDKDEYMVFEIECVADYINVIMFYRFFDMMEKLEGLNIFKNLEYNYIYKFFNKYLIPKKNYFLQYRDFIIKGQINWKNEAEKLLAIVKRDNETGELDPMIDVINSYLYNPTDVYYRGVGNMFYPEQPGIFRLHIGENETKMFKDMIVKYPHTFKNSNTIESLTHMQHYEIKTRMLDVTTNPLVALYMAVNKIYTGDPEQLEYDEVIVYFTDVNSVKYYDSNKVLLNSKLVFLSSSEKKSLHNFINQLKSLGDVIFFKIQERIWNNEKNNHSLIDSIVTISNGYLFRPDVKNALDAYYKLLSIVRQDIPSFINKIELLGLLKAYIVNVGYVNERIAAQSGGFILFGLDKDYLINPNSNADDILSSRIIDRFPRIIIKNKIKIYEELNAIGINDSTMIPDIEHASKFIIDKYR